MNLKSVKPLLPPSKEAVAEEQQTGGVGQCLGEDGKIDAANARAESEKAEHQRHNARQQGTPSGRRKGKLEKGFQNDGQGAPAQENQEIRDRLVVLTEVANHPHQIHTHHVAAQGEKEGLAQAQHASVTPEQVHADRQDGVAQVLPVKVDAEIADMQKSAIPARRRSKQGNDYHHAG
jgi:hypothetical protein